ncbi:unnamed protein product [Trifolium pratense]|uniref:Uncharacterized protein n=1 Tax=Trifolium pratense TaxID=57577 RepID=A0ACB0JG09_TRIPR|nr:unnamed protein product [Trifolium pratense]
MSHTVAFFEQQPKHSNYRMPYNQFGLAVGYCRSKLNHYVYAIFTTTTLLSYPESHSPPLISTHSKLNTQLEHIKSDFYPNRTAKRTHIRGAWLEPLNIPSGKSSVCDFCGEPLQFLLQVYAPVVEKETTFHRMLFVFMCPSMTCLLRDQHEQWKRDPEKLCRSMKVFRCQLPRNNPFYSSECPKYDGSDKPTGSGAALCDWCGTWKGDKLCSSCKQVRYCSEKHQAMSWHAGH